MGLGAIVNILQILHFISIGEMCCTYILCSKLYSKLPSRNHLVRSCKILQDFHIQDLQDLVLNLTGSCKKVYIFLEKRTFYCKNPTRTHKNHTDFLARGKYFLVGYFAACHEDTLARLRIILTRVVQDSCRKSFKFLQEFC